MPPYKFPTDRIITPQRRKYLKNHNRKRYEVGNTYIKKAKSVPCADCGIQYKPHQMDFDHVRGEKKRGVADMPYYSVAAIEAEITKCEVVCSNCHRDRTYVRAQYTEIVCKPDPQLDLFTPDLRLVK